jgi:hypothetical protein
MRLKMVSMTHIYFQLHTFINNNAWNITS